MKQLTPFERLIVAADFKPLDNLGRASVKDQVLALADSLKGTGAYLKVNSALRAAGFDLIDEIHARGLRVFADLKLNDIGATLATDGAILREVKPELLTVMCTSGDDAMAALKAELPDTEVLGVTVLTSMDEREAARTFCHAVLLDNVCMLVEKADGAGLDGVICAPSEICPVRRKVGNRMTINTPGIRPLWAIVPGDDQNPDRIMTPAKAIEAGADRIVVGRPITKPPQGMMSLDAVQRTIDEIAEAMAMMEIRD